MKKILIPLLLCFSLTGFSQKYIKLNYYGNEVPRTIIDSSLIIPTANDSLLRTVDTLGSQIRIITGKFYYSFNGHWHVLGSGGSGGVSSFGFTNSHGITGSVTNGTSSPVLSMYLDTVTIFESQWKFKQDTIHLHNGIASKENALGNPSTNGYVLSSLTNGTRSWVILPSSNVPGSTGIAYWNGTGWGTPYTVSGTGNVLLSATQTAANSLLLEGKDSTYIKSHWSGSSSFSLTTTGTSGASTYIGGILNIPVYSGGSGSVTSVGSTNTNGITWNITNPTTTPNIYFSWDSIRFFATQTQLKNISGGSPVLRQVSSNTLNFKSNNIDWYPIRLTSNITLSLDTTSCISNAKGSLTIYNTSGNSYTVKWPTSLIPNTSYAVDSFIPTAGYESIYSLSTFGHGAFRVYKRKLEYYGLASGQASSPTIVSAYTDQTGDTVHILFNKSMNSPISTGWIFNPNNGIASVSLHSTNSSMYDFVISSPFTVGASVNVSYSGSTTSSSDAGILQTVTNYSVTNNTVLVPVTVGGLVVWGDATSVTTKSVGGINYITQYNDLSGNGNNLMPIDTVHTYLGELVTHDTILTCYTQGVTGYIISSFNNTFTNGATFFFDYNYISKTGFDITVGTSGNVTALVGGDYVNVFLASFINGAYSIGFSGTPYALNEHKLITIVFQNGINTVQIYKNNTLMGSATTSAFPLTSNKLYYLCQSSSGTPVNSVNGYSSCMLIYNTPLSGSNLTKVQNYLIATKKIH